MTLEAGIMVTIGAVLGMMFTWLLWPPTSPVISTVGGDLWVLKGDSLVLCERAMAQLGTVECRVVARVP